MARDQLPGINAISTDIGAPARPWGPRLRSGLAVWGVAFASVLGLGSCDDTVPGDGDPREPAPVTQPEPSEPGPTQPEPEPTAGGGGLRGLSLQAPSVRERQDLREVRL